MSQAGSIVGSSGQQMVKFVSPTINFTATGNTTLLTNGTDEFVPYAYTFVTDAVTNFSGDGTFNIGFTAAAYDDYVQSVAFGFDDVNQFSSFLIDEPGAAAGYPLLQPSTALVLNITSGVTADVCTGRCIVFGFTV